jgi:hypothetical protein
MLNSRPAISILTMAILALDSGYAYSGVIAKNDSTTSTLAPTVDPVLVRRIEQALLARNDGGVMYSNLSPDAKSALVKSIAVMYVKEKAEFVSKLPPGGNDGDCLP